jgi:hypothetical protein
MNKSTGSLLWATGIVLLFVPVFMNYCVVGQHRPTSHVQFYIGLILWTLSAGLVAGRRSSLWRNLWLMLSVFAVLIVVEVPGLSSWHDAFRPIGFTLVRWLIFVSGGVVIGCSRRLLDATSTVIPETDS